MSGVRSSCETLAKNSVRKRDTDASSRSSARTRWLDWWCRSMISLSAKPISATGPSTTAVTRAAVVAGVDGRDHPADLAQLRAEFTPRRRVPSGMIAVEWSTQASLIRLRRMYKSF